MDDALCAFRRMPDHPLAGAARAATDARAFFESHFVPEPSRAVQATGYYEPELDASLTPTDEFRIPLHAQPEGGCTLRRADIDVRLKGREIAFLRDEVDRSFLQVQGSGRLRLRDGTTRRLRYGGGNGQPYRSIGQMLIQEGVFGLGLTADALKDWLRADPVRGRAVMDRNPSYVFFRFHDGPPDEGPIGTLGVPLTPMCSLAADPDHLPLGTPVWLTLGGQGRLWVAQDTGGAIKGPGRVDLFYGTGESAGQTAGALNANGRITPLGLR
jgi:membrane-bound lytic murein transglycosylase A